MAAPKNQLRLFTKPRKSRKGAKRGGKSGANGGAKSGGVKLLRGRRPKGWSPESGKPRPPKGLPHLRREGVPAKCPVHVTLRVLPHVWNLRSKRAWGIISAAVAGSQSRFGFQVVMFTLMGNHLHLVCEAQDRLALAKGVRSLEIRAAMRLNRMMGTRGRVFSDRYGSRVLRSATEVARVVSYVRNQYQHHFEPRGSRVAQAMAAGWRDPYSRSGFERADVEEGVVRPPRTTLLARDWKFVRVKDRAG
jgi:REP element-mobilizing transposase RayT